MGLLVCGKISDDILAIRYLANEEEHKVVYEGLTQKRVIPINLNGRLLSYSFNQIVGLENYKSVKKKVDNSGEVFALREISKELIDTFLEANPGERRYIESEAVDFDLTPVMVVKNKIIGIFYISRIRDDRIGGTYVYLSKSENYQILMPILLVKAVDLGVKMIGKDSGIIFLCSLYDIYLELKKALGAPYLECLVNEYYVICETKYELELAREEIYKFNLEQGEKVFPEKEFIDYLNSPISGWDSPVVIGRIPYLDDLTELPERQLKAYKRSLFEQFTQWGYNAEWELNRIMASAKRRRSKVDIITIENFNNKECKKIYEKFYDTLEYPKREDTKVDLSSINYYLADSSTKEVYDILPEYIKDELDKRSFFLVCALTEDRELIGYTLMTWSDYYRGNIILAGIFTMKVYDDTDLIKRLLEKSMSLAYDMGSDYFFMRQQVDFTELDEFEFERKNPEYLLMYEGVTLLKNYKNVESVRVHDSTEIKASVMEDAELLGKYEGFVFVAKEIDKEMHMFVEYHNELMGTLCAKKISEGILLIYDYWVSEKNWDKFLLAKMISALLQKVAINMREATRIMIRAKDEKEIEVYHEILGQENECRKYNEVLYDLNKAKDKLIIGEISSYVPKDVNIINAFIEKLGFYKKKYNREQSFGIQEITLLSSVQNLHSDKVIL